MRVHELWPSILANVPQEQARIAIGKEILRLMGNSGHDPEDLFQSGYDFLTYLEERDDEVFLQCHGVYNGSLDEVRKVVLFELHHNALKPERAESIITAWERLNSDIQPSRAAIQQEMEWHEARLATLKSALQDIQAGQQPLAGIIPS